MIRTARFGPDFQTVLYGALWDGDVCRVYTVRPESPESSAIAAATGHAAGRVEHRANWRWRSARTARGIMTYGTLARVPLAGGAPRELQEQVKYADWSPDGRELAIVRRVGDRDRARVSRRHVDRRGGRTPAQDSAFRASRRAATPWRCSSWSSPAALWGKRRDRRSVRNEAGGVGAILQRLRAGVEAATRCGSRRPTNCRCFATRCYAMNASGAVRIVARVPGNTSLHDIAPDGRVLIARTDDRGGISVRVPGEAAERDLSWLDAANLADMSRRRPPHSVLRDRVSAAGREGSIYLRGTDGSPAVRLGDGQALALSPDGRWAIVQTDSTHLDLIPTGAGPADGSSGRG